MNTPETIDEWFLPGWPGRTQIIISPSGTHLSHFELAEKDEIIHKWWWKVVTIERMAQDNLLTGRRELWWDMDDERWDLPMFLYKVLTDSQRRVIWCLQGRGKKNFTQ